ncbi:MAG: hypothetical protein HYT94_04050, partial [Parcubacteria group bacterium]|nr:hypothetical protein [Parcubacteria group bacterium]
MNWIKNHKADIALALVSFVVTIVVVDAVLYFTHYRYVILKTIYPRFYFMKDLEIGHDIGINVATTTHLFEDSSYPVWSNDLGCFDTAYASETPYIYLAGDSLTWGFSPFEDMWGTRTQDIVGVRTLKCGVTGGYGTKQEFIKAFLIGLFLGNVGVGCPNPLFNAVILPQIVVEASALNGLWIMFIHGLGRVTPLLLIAFLAILGVNATGFLVRHREKVERATGWGMIFVGGFLILIGAFGHDGYSYSGIHSFFERITQEEVITNILGEKIKTLGHGHEIPQGEYLAYGPWVMVLAWIIPMFWWLLRERNRLRDLSPEEETRRRPYVNAKTWFILSTSALLALTFGWALPHNFVFQTAHEEMPPVAVRVIKDAVIEAQEATLLRFELKDRLGEPARDLEYSHERLLHTLIVSEDFTQFWHLHPEDQTVLTQEMLKNAVFPLVHTFPRGGRYIVALDSKHQGHEVSYFEVIEVAKGPAEVGPTVITKDFSREKL